MDLATRTEQLEARDGELASLHGVIDEVGASYPLLVHLPDADPEPEEFEQESSLDPLIFEGLVRP